METSGDNAKQCVPTPPQKKIAHCEVTQPPNNDQRVWNHPSNTAWRATGDDWYTNNSFTKTRLRIDSQTTRFDIDFFFQINGHHIFRKQGKNMILVCANQNRKLLQEVKICWNTDRRSQSHLAAGTRHDTTQRYNFISANKHTLRLSEMWRSMVDRIW